ncbi:MAG: GGDEF domain-containing protein [Sterolibacterium sp.]|jgi:diguanylate cyclase (GGDEF)-like protein|nr:GGDEF domain-containing protein [Sterolibacterium sp.]
MFEIQTFAYTLLPLLLASLIVLLFNWRIHRKMRGTGSWAAGAASRLAGVALIAIDDTLPLFLSSFIGYFLVVFGDFLSVRGLSLFAGRPPSRRITLAVLFATLVSLGYFTYVEPAPYLRVIVLVAGHVISVLLLATLQVRIIRQEGMGGVAVLVLSSFWEIILGPLLLLAMHMVSSNVEIEAELGWVSWAQPMGAMAMMGILQTFGFILLAANRTERELRDMALLDTLTGIPNRRAFDAAMKRAVEATKRNHTRLGLAVVDIDFFKRVNDTYGHGVGDELLRHVAITISATLRDSDFFARIGGEEFALIVEDSTPEALLEVAERFRLAVETLPLQRTQETPLACTLSAGIALSEPGRADASRLYVAADAALYRAKGNGRNRVELA